MRFFGKTMKAAAVAAAMTLLLTGCAFGQLSGNKEYDVPPDKAYVFDAAVSDGGFEWGVTLTRESKGAWTAAVFEPYALQGLTLSLLSDGTVRAELDGISANADENFSGAVKKIISAFETAIAKDGTTAAEEKETIKIRGGDFTLTVQKDGVPVSIELDGGAAAEFTNAAVTDFSGEEETHVG